MSDPFSTIMAPPADAVSVADLTPTSGGVSLYVRVLAVDAVAHWNPKEEGGAEEEEGDDRASQRVMAASALVADGTGCVKLVACGPRQVAALKPGATLRVEGGHVDMFLDRWLRVVVPLRWGRLKEVVDAGRWEPNTTRCLSAEEWTVEQLSVAAL